MQLRTDHVRVRVPATSANLGPGFDALGLALAHHDEIEARVVDGPHAVVEVQGEGASDLPSGEDHLVVKAVRAGLEHVGADQVGLHLRCVNRIPHGRGMGSSAAAVVAGLLVARSLVGQPGLLDEATVLDLATRFEGHPDNAAPALLGGATIAWSTPAGVPRASVIPLRDDVEAVVLVPHERCATHKARGVLPATVPHADAAYTAGRAALLVHALCHDPTLLLEATEDALHQSYRAEVMAPTWQLVLELRARGQAAVVSGAGPSVLVLQGPDADGQGARARREALAATGVDAGEWRELRPGIDLRGARAVAADEVTAAR